MDDNTKKEMIAGKERLLCYSAAILCSLLGNENNNTTIKGLIPGSIAGAKELIKQVYESE